MKKILFIIAILLVAVSAWGMEKKWFYSPNGPLFRVKGGSISYSLKCPYTSANDSCANGEIIGGSTANCGDATSCDAGSFTVVDAGAGTVDITSNKVVIMGTSGLNQTYAYSPAFTKSFSKLVRSGMNADAIGIYSHQLGISSATTLVESTNSVYGINLGYIGGLLGWYLTSMIPTGVASAATDYISYIILGGYNSSGVPYKLGDTKTDYLYGAAGYISGGAYSVPTLVWREPSSNTGTLYAYIGGRGSGAIKMTYDDTRIVNKDLGSVLAPLTMKLDTFTATTGTVLTAHTSDVGSTYTKRVSDAVWQIDTNTAEMTGGGTNPANNATLRYVVTTAFADGEFDATVRCDITNGAANGLVFRQSAETSNGINLIVYRLVGDGTNCDEYLTKYVDGTPTNIYANASGTMTNTTQYKLRAITRANLLWIYRDGASIIGASPAGKAETFNQTATGFGIFADVTSLTDKAFDNLYAFPITDSAYNVLTGY